MKKHIFAWLLIVPLGCVGVGELDHDQTSNNNGSGSNNMGTSSSNNGASSNNRTSSGTNNKTNLPCKSPEAVFERQTWPDAGTSVCTGCHISGGVAAEAGSSFVLKNETALSTEGLTLDAFYAFNLEQFRKVRLPLVDGLPLFISKAKGVGHGGGEVAKENSDTLKSLEALEESFETAGDDTCEKLAELDPLSDLLLLTPQETLRKSTMMLAGRLPTTAELQQIDSADTDEAEIQMVETLLDDVMQGDMFHEWLKYAWNEIFMFRGLWAFDITFPFLVVDNLDFGARDWPFLGRAGGVGCDFVWEGTQVWERFNYPSIEICDNNFFGRNYMTPRVGYSLIEGPLELMAHIVEQDMPFSKILTTDIVMMNYYSSLVYYGSGQPDKNPFIAQYFSGLPMDTLVHPAGATIAEIDLPTLHEYRPMTSVRRNSLRTRAGVRTYEYDDVSEFPRSGILTSQPYLTRYPTTATNVNRHRTWAFMQQFLGIDILALADRRGDPAEAELMSDQPTIDDPNCNVCHNVMDPVAGLFQDFGINGRWNESVAWPPGNQPAMLEAGISLIGPTPNLPYDPDSGLAPIQWLGQETVKDPRFSTTMVNHAFLQLTGHKPMNPPTDAKIVGWRGLRKAFELETAFISTLRQGFISSNFNMKWLYKKIIVSPYYRTKDVANEMVKDDEVRLAAVGAFGGGDQLLTPFELLRKVEAILGRPWQFRGLKKTGNNLRTIDPNALENDFFLRNNSDNDFRYIDGIYRDMYGGIDFFNNTSRLHLPSSVMAAAGRRVAYEFACASVAADFAIDLPNRIFFSELALQDTMETNAAGIEKTIQNLSVKMLGRLPTNVELKRMTDLFTDVQSEGAIPGSTLPAHCWASEKLLGQTGRFTPLERDPDYGIRAWMTVISYLAMDPQFLFEW